jgi:hypothetical protein
MVKQMNTASLRTQKFRYSEHVLHRLEQRKIPTALVKHAIAHGYKVPGKTTDVGDTFLFRLGAFQVAVGQYGSTWNIISAYWNDEVTGIRGGDTPPLHLVEKFLMMKNGW